MTGAHPVVTDGADETRVSGEWGGGVSPFRVSWAKLMMWLFLLSDTLTFAGLLSGYGYSRLSSPSWPASHEVFNLNLVGLMTFILICSSATMAMAVTAAKSERWADAVRFVGLTILGGLVFLGMQAYEWSHFIGEGARLSGNPWGAPLFSASFFVITGFHGLHVTAGVVYLATVLARSARRRYTADGVEVAGLYWHFVDLVWVFIFTLLYLI
ncbi:cytochrome c oxidase subunit 3 [Carboxydochorda subterranea]|uniref:Cytochrome c oxidase subunit 3 n=1 Tax=Carboxydichorda subterranea TaxID=3109565 RepID=A0ABZ1C356_9FIRM|nr:cytochrome c oxidase subunit 3 [Limnochorda sp. L945t]WRP18538.1 cytochrome c oxidase subunit 3 [Limnochorda sp. L945t]